MGGACACRGLIIGKCSKSRENVARQGGKVMGVKISKPEVGSNTRGIRVLSVVELTRIELATS
jgi:hypothetical protein